MGAALVTLGASSLCECAACCACSLLTACVSFTMSQMRRISHFLILVVTLSLAIVLGRIYPDQLVNTYATSLAKIDLTGGCDSAYLDECLYRQLIYRASLALVLLFSVLAVGSYFFDVIDKSFWPLKFTLALGIFTGFLFCDNSAFSSYAEFARVSSFGWLLIQGLLILDLAHGAHDVIMQKAEEEDYKTRGDSRIYLALYLLLSIGFLVLAGAGVIMLFTNYSGCELGKNFTIVTLVTGILTTLVSLLQAVNKGLLTPCICFAYSTFLCWYALLSCPDATCNPSSGDNLKTSSVAIVTSISCTVLLVCVCYGSKVLSIFEREGEGLLNESGTAGPRSSSNKDLEVTLVAGVSPTPLPYTSIVHDDDEKEPKVDEPNTAKERGFYHILMALFSSFCLMILTSWGAVNGAPEVSAPSSESMWLKVVAQWAFLLLYVKMQHAAYLDNAA